MTNDEFEDLVTWAGAQLGKAAEARGHLIHLVEEARQRGRQEAGIEAHTSGDEEILDLLEGPVKQRVATRFLTLRSGWKQLLADKKQLEEDLSAKEEALIDLAERYARDTAELQERLKGKEDGQEEG